MRQRMRLMMFSTAVLAATCCQQRAHGNLLTNPGFESGSSGWSTFGVSGFGFLGGGALTPKEGDGHVEIFSVGGSAFVGAFQDVPVVGGADYVLSGWLRNGRTDGVTADDFLQGSDRAVIEIQWLDAGSSFISVLQTDPVEAGVTPEDAEWRFRSLAPTAPSNAAFARITALFIDDGSIQGGSASFDALSFAAKAPEPTSVVLALLAAVGCLLRRPRRTGNYT